jgi:hypothetical protein
MSYLDFPRLVVSGSFYTDPSTMDNDPSHYDPANTNPSPWQDPGGSHNFSFQDLLAGELPNRDFTPPTVVCAFNQSGQASLTDPIVNQPVNSTDTPGGLSGATPSPAKLIDLDVYQQAVSTIYGFFLQLTVGSSKLVGEMDLTSLDSVRFDRVLPTGGWAAWNSYGAGSFGGDTFALGRFPVCRSHSGGTMARIFGLAGPRPDAPAGRDGRQWRPDDLRTHDRRRIPECRLAS